MERRLRERLLPKGLLQHLLWWPFMLTAGAAQGASLHICPAPDPAQAPPTGLSTSFTRPDGSRQLAYITESPVMPGCRSHALPIAARDIEGLRALSGATAQQLGQHFSITGPAAGPTLAGDIATRPPAPPAHSPARPSRRAMPLLANLLPQLETTVFGSEERASFRRDGTGIVLTCTAGSKPAGLLLRGPWRLPAASVTLELRGTGQGSFKLLAADTQRAASDAGLLLGEWHPAANGTENVVSAALPGDAHLRQQWHSFTLACPADAGELRLAALTLQPQPRPVPGRAAWFWQAQNWQTAAGGAALLGQAQRHHIGLLYVTVPLSAGKNGAGMAVSHPRELAAFIGRAARAGVTVWAVDGDPAMARPREHAATVRRMAAYAAYNASAAAGDRLGGVQFDVEPYLLPEYAQAPAQWDAHYVALMRALREAAPAMPLEVALPFWWGEKDAPLKELAQSIDSINVMDYRTDATQIMQFAVPFLEWGARHGKRVRIALESGPLAPEIQRHYELADKTGEGELWHVPLDGSHFLLLLAKAGLNPEGAAYRATAQRPIDGSETTFAGRPEQLLAMLPGLEAAFAAWPGFAGVALHAFLNAAPPGSGPAPR
jgi:hypothetical protein